MINKANNHSTDIFKNFTGVMNMAPIKLSGQYKIVVDVNKNLYLDDYTGRRVLLDTSNSFLPQVASFLRNRNETINSEDYQYGGFQRGTTKSYHVPLYLATKEYPKYFVLNRIASEELDDIDFLYKYADTILVHDLKRLGLHKIFDEIFRERYFDFPFYFNWDDGQISIYGFSLTDGGPHKHTFPLDYEQANQNYYDVFNNRMINKFAEYNLIFPKFINIEFEFDYSANSNNPFTNFSGFLSNDIEILPEDIDYDYVNMIVRDGVSEFSAKQVYNERPVDNLSEFNDKLGTVTIVDVAEQNAQFSMLMTRVDMGDIIEIYDYANIRVFQYQVSSKDIVESSFYETLIKFCQNLTKESNNQFLFKLKEFNNPNSKQFTIIIQNNSGDGFEEDYVVVKPDYYVSENNTFMGIGPNDVWLCNNIELNETTYSLGINDQIYTIEKQFVYNDNVILRLNERCHIEVLTYVDLFVVKSEKLLRMIPIQKLTFYNDLESELIYNAELYVNQLKQLYPNENTEINGSKFLEKVTPAQYQYVVDFDKPELSDDNKLPIKYNNEDYVKHIWLASPGSSSLITPNILNIDKHFFLQSGNLDPSLLINDKHRYNWFLINGICPEYLKNTIHNLRYFDGGYYQEQNHEWKELPKLTAEIIAINDDYCETVFLGVRYRFPIKYKGYQFATVLNFDYQRDTELNYNFRIDIEKKTIYLCINKYIDFSDLIRGGDNNNQPLLDLSFFYNVSESFNENSDFLYAFKTSGLRFGQNFKKGEYILFKDIPVYDWKYESNGKWYIAILREVLSIENSTNDLTMLFPESGDSKFYVYSTIEYNGIEYTYISLEITVHNIVDLKSEYLWCEDVTIKFFDTEYIFLTRWNNKTLKDEVISVRRENIIREENKNNDTPFGNYHQISTVIVDSQNQQFELITNQTLRFKEEYFEINQVITENELGEQTMVRTPFKFPESRFTDDQIMLFDYKLNEPDWATYENRISLFQRNQIWLVIQDLFRYDLKFKYFSEEQIQLLLNDFTINKLIDWSDMYSIESDSVVSGENEWVKIRPILLDKNSVIWKYQEVPRLNLIGRHKTAYRPFLSDVQNTIDFQLNKYKKNNRLHSIYDSEFIEIDGTKLAATGFWKELEGNIVSSLYCNYRDITVTMPYQEILNIFDIFKSSIPDNIIIGNENREYIENINKNYNVYITDLYAQYLLDNFYRLDRIVNELGERMEIIETLEETNQIRLKQKHLYLTNFKTIKIIFTRK